MAKMPIPPSKIETSSRIIAEAVIEPIDTVTIQSKLFNLDVERLRNKRM